MATIEIRVPDIGDFKDVPIIEVHVKPGEKVNAEDPLITLESDKATMDVPAPAAGRDGGRGAGQDRRPGLRGHRDPYALNQAPKQPAPPPRRCGREHRPLAAGPRGDLHAEVLVLGAGPGGYTRRVPRRRSRQEGRAGRALADAWRRLPQCRLHPFESAAARGEGDRRDRTRWRRAASASARTRHRHRQAARLEGRRGQAPDRRAGGARQAAQGDGGRGHRQVRLAQPDRSDRHGRRDQDRQLRAGDHRRGIGAGDPAVHSA